MVALPVNGKNARSFRLGRIDRPSRLRTSAYGKGGIRFCIARSVGRPRISMTAALLHDVGKLVLARFMDGETLTALAAARAEGDRTAMQAEVDVLGVHHGQLGGLICRHWNLPDRLAEAVAHHHTPDKANDVLCDVVHIANIAARLAAGRPEDQLPPDVTPMPSSVERLGLSGAFLERLCNHVTRRLDEVMSRYAVATQPLPLTG